MRSRSLFFSASLCVSLAACGEGSGSGKDPSGHAPSLGVVDLSKLVKEDLIEGTGATAMSGKIVSVNYVGTLENGTQFDSSYDAGQPFIFRLGAGYVIAGWDVGLQGMRVGGKRRLTIPPALGYGSRGAGTIPPNSTLIFEVELLSVK